MVKPDEKPLRDLIGKKVEVLGYETKVYNTNEYTIIRLKVKPETKAEGYYTSSRTVKRQLEELNKANKLPISTELITGAGHKGKWLAFRL
jgi:hypothetical protein